MQYPEFLKSPQARFCPGHLINPSKRRPFAAPLKEQFQVQFIALRFNVHGSVGFVPYKSIDIERLGSLQCRISEPDTLHPPAYVNIQMLHLTMYRSFMRNSGQRSGFGYGSGI